VSESKQAAMRNSWRCSLMLTGAKRTTKENKSESLDLQGGRNECIKFV